MSQSNTARGQHRTKLRAFPVVRFGLNTDAHLLGRRTPDNEASFRRFVDEMICWKPDFVVDLGDFGCQCGKGVTTEQMHDCQLKALKHHVAVFSRVPCPRYHVLGNHDVGWLRGGDEEITPDQLIGHAHAGEDITKTEFLAITKTPYRYYAFDINGFHFIVLDGNNGPDETSPLPGHDGIAGAYYIDGIQKQWLGDDLKANRDKPKIVFCHEELHHTSLEGSGEGGDVPFLPVSKDASYVDNGWELRDMFAKDGKVLACFFGHKHRNRWTVHGGTHYITIAATHWLASYGAVTISDRLLIKGFGGQRTYSILFE